MKSGPGLSQKSGRELVLPADCLPRRLPRESDVMAGSFRDPPSLPGIKQNELLRRAPLRESIQRKFANFNAFHKEDPEMGTIVLLVSLLGLVLFSIGLLFYITRDLRED